MLWIIQNNLFNEEGYVRFVEALERLECEYLVIKPVPFTNRLLPADFDSTTQEVDDVAEPHIDPNQKIIAFGATSLTRVALDRGWIPGTYLNDNFDFNVWSEKFGADNILNNDAVVGPIHSIKRTIGRLMPNEGHYFVRPTLDNKAIAGTVMSDMELIRWLDKISEIEVAEEERQFCVLHRYTEMMVSSVKTIYSECRLFVVDGIVVTASMYKSGDDVHADSNVDQRFIDFVYSLGGTMPLTAHPKWQWQPAEAFVIDVADTPDGLKVIEINNINSAGYYAADVQKIIVALEDLNR